MKLFDLQVNGAYGVDFADPALTADDFLRASEKILDGGCTRFLPTLPTAAPETYRRNLPLINEAVDSHGLRYAIPGFHLEGPFISKEPGAVGAHFPGWVQEPSPEALELLDELSGHHIALLTAAAEVPGMPALIARAHELGICVSLGHQLADEAQIAAAGAEAMTHLGNGLPNLIDRHRNPIWSGLANDEITVMAIADGHHLPASVLKCYIRCKGLDRLIIVSDACNVAGLPPGHYHSFSNDAVLEPDGKYHNPAKGCLVGASILLSGCAAFLQRAGLLDEAGIARVCWDNPHRLLHLQA